MKFLRISQHFLLTDVTLNFLYILRGFYVLNEILTYNFRQVIQKFFLRRSQNFQKLKKNVYAFVY